jgi:hypothetical protein
LVISSAVEGAVDEAVVGRLIETSGATIGPLYGKRGKANLLARLSGFNEAARRFPWLVLIDLDSDFPCGPAALSVWLPAPSPWMCFRIAIREAEAWMLGDGDAVASFFGVTVSRVPRDPESLDDPKAALVNLAQRSRRRDVREDMVPRPGSGRVVGPGYTSRVMEFVRQSWRPELAAARAPSLRRSLDALEALRARGNAS